MYAVGGDWLESMGTQELCTCKGSNHYALLCYSDNGYSLVSKRDMALPSQSHEITYTKHRISEPLLVLRDKITDFQTVTDCYYFCGLQRTPIANA